MFWCACGNYLTAFFRRGLEEVEQLGYSHQIRWRNTARLQRLFSAGMRDSLRGYDPVAGFLTALNGRLPGWGPLAQAQYIEVATFMSPYLLSSQGDRMMAANSVEGRFPFLDHRVVEFCNRLPPRFKIRGLQEKHVLKKSAQGLLPPQVWRRRKQPYRAPIHTAFFGQSGGYRDPSGGYGNPPYVEELLAPEAIRAGGIFDPSAVSRLALKCRTGKHIGERDDMALVGVLSTQLVQQLFVDNFPPRPVEEAHPVRICRGKE